MNRARVINFDQCLVIPCFKVEVRTGLRSQAYALARAPLLGFLTLNTRANYPCADECR